MPLRLRVFGGLVLERDGAPLVGRAVQRRRLALLALLAAAPGRAVTRDRLLALLWPDRDTEQARHLLSVAIYDLRRGAGADVVESRGDDVVLSPAAVATDIDIIDTARREGRLEDAVAGYEGPFLDGVHLGTSGEFDTWLDGERDRQTRAHAADLERLAADRAAAGDAVGAVDAWHRLAALDRFSGRVVLGLMLALEAAGDRTAAIRQASVHAVLVREEFDAEPDPDVVALADRLRQLGASEPRPLSDAPAAPNAAASPAPAAAAVSVAPVHGGARRSKRGAGRELRLVRRLPVWPRALMRRGRFALLASVLLFVAAFSIGRPWRVILGGEASVAVLPFLDLGADNADQYFADGVAEELINALSQVDGLRVVARTSSFAFGPTADVRRVGRELGISYVVEGSVRRSGTRITIVARLVSSRIGYALLTERRDVSAARVADDIVAVQEEIARSIVERLRFRVEHGSRPLARAGTSDLQALAWYNEGRTAYHQRTPAELQRALRLFTAAAARDEAYALAHAGIAETAHLLGAYDYGVLRPADAFPRADSAAARALLLAPDLAEAHAARAAIAFNYDWDWDAADASFRRALELSPGFAQGWHWYSLYLMARGRTAEGRAAVNRAHDLSPLSPVIATAAARISYLERDYARARAEYGAVLGRDPSFVTALLGQGLAAAMAGDHDAAIAAYERAQQVLATPAPVIIGLLGHTYGRAGRIDAAQRQLDLLNSIAATDAYVPAEYRVITNIGLGRHADAIAALREAFDHRSGGIAYLAADPIVDPLRDEPAFIEIMKRAGIY